MRTAAIFYDLTVLVLTVIGLYRVSRRSELYATICMQGVWYFVLTAVINVPAVVRARARLVSRRV